MTEKIKQIYDFLKQDKFLDILDEKYEDYFDDIYFEIFKGNRKDFDSINWFVVIHGIIRFEYIDSINKIGKENKDDLIEEYFENLQNRRAEIIKIAKLVDEYSNLVIREEMNY
ncbi:MAG: hypothetical protein RSD22_09770 [Romboutsia sp.]